MDTSDIWRPIPNFPDYRINTRGEILSYRRRTEQLLRPILYKNGYCVRLFNREGGLKSFTVARLMLLTFKPLLRPSLYVASFKDDNPNNLAIENLEWKRHSGGSHPKAKLTDAQASEIRQLYADDLTQTQDAIAQRYGVTDSTIGMIINHKTYTAEPS